jgi:MoxR-like ATPase
MSQVPGLFIGDDTVITGAHVIKVITALRELTQTEEGIKGARDLISSFPLTVTFDEIIEWQRDKDSRLGTESTFELPEAIERAKSVARRITELGIPAEVVEPTEDGRDNAVVRLLAKLIENSEADGYHRVAMLEGGTGVGKSGMMRRACELAKVPAECVGYWSLPTLAPEDMVGIPYPDETSSQHFRYLVLKGLNEYQVMILDETNRAQPKILNAIMQLMLEGRINDVQFPNLKAIFLAINPPEDGNYVGTEEMDDAIRQRVDHFIQVKGEPNKNVLARLLVSVPRNFLLEQAEEIAECGVEWWGELSKDQKMIVNPRRIEKILRAFRDKEGLETTMDKRDPRGTVPLDLLVKKLRKIEIMDLATLLADPAAIEARMKAGGADAADLQFRYQQLVKQMKVKRMDRQFVSVAHLYNYVAKDMIPHPERDKSLYYFVTKAVARYSDDVTAQAYIDILAERAAGRKAQEAQLKKVTKVLFKGLEDSVKKAL